MTKVLITGGAGYIGSILTRRLLDEGFWVTVLDNFMFKQNSLLSCCQEEKFDIINGDVRDVALLTRLTQKHDIIIPLAALVGAPMCSKDEESTFRINTQSIRDIVSSSSKDQRILMPVTNSGYGIGEKGTVCDESSPLRPLTAYGRSKVEAEAAILERENSISFRLATAFGVSPRMRIDLLVNDFVYRAVTDKSLVIFEGAFKRNYIHVRDIARVFSHGISNFERLKGSVFNVGIENLNLSKLELAAEIKRSLPDFQYTESAVGEDPDKRDYIVSNAKLYKTGFIPEWTLSRGIKELVKAYIMLNNRTYGNV